MLNEDDFKRWLSGEVKPERRPKSIRLTKRNTSREAIEFLWPAGIPDGLANQDIVKRVSDRLKEEGLTVPSPDTILRAAERKH
ncbi:hypothetical protein [Bradyrhizobium sp. 2S1]|uniref:hypothetical protein n=1 Tax=Bradyrhizobium sp. 2S1 TaxID=1404429 RepID=UPI001409CB76|nr:hypothetical protein [Bradyrhizobium sp. 2S1]MCK7665837.1 hypothetical protein [Bradyrhizobium sp. 2S1]